MSFRFLLLLAFFFGSAAARQRLGSRADLAALYSLRASLGLRARDWPRRADPCAAWAGVGCREGRVTELRLSGLRRTRRARRAPRFALDAVRNLTALAALNASGFPLPGPIPDWFGGGLPASLATLDLRSATISGAIPYSLGAAAGLRELYLGGNAITGDIPPTLGQLFNLSVLDLSSNSLIGSIPPELGSLGNLSLLDLSSNFLSSPIPSTFGSLRSLKTLNLSNNSLFGSIPLQVGNLTELLSLDLSSNSLMGILPDELSNLRSLKNLNLGKNSFTGSLPESLFSGLTQLQFVKLSHNNFSGSLPDSLWSLSELELLDVSNNNLTGALPEIVSHNASASSGGPVFNLSNNLYYGSISSAFLILFQRFKLVDISNNYFQGSMHFNKKNGNFSIEANCFRNASKQRSAMDCKEFYEERDIPYDGPPSPNPTPTPSSSGRKRNKDLKYILAGVFGGLGLILIVVLVLILCLRRRGARAIDKRESSGNVIPSVNRQPPDGVLANPAAVGDSFTYEQLLQATSGFNSSNLIKNGHSGALYRGVLEDGVHVAVKRIKREAYPRELHLFSKASHIRLVPFVGQCLDNENEKLLVYKYMQNGDLSNALYRKQEQGDEDLQSLDWITRLKIAIGVAEALCFLHHECNPPWVHRDVQASSILLDDKFEVRLGSLSEVCTQEGDGRQGVITRFLRSSSQVTKQNVSGSPSATCAYDVYCVGKVLLELVTGKLGISASNDAVTNELLEQILPYINICEKELMMKIVDPSLIVNEDLLEEVWAMAIVAKSCLNPRPSKRPLMRHILKALENPLKVVREENYSYSGRFRTLSSRGSWNAAFYSSWRRSSSDVASLGGPREDQSIRHSGTIRSQGSGGEQSSSRKRHSNEIFPEPSSMAQDIED